MRDFLLAFVPIFVAVDAIGVVPVFLNLTEGLDKLERRRIVLQSFVTALAVAVGFIFLGKAVFRVMGVTEYDFMVAGGVLLFVLATVDLVSGVKFARQMPTLGAFPIGTPLIVGPAVLTTSLMLVDVYGLWPTLAAVVVNVALGCVVLLSADILERALGRAGSRAVSKVAMLILAAIAVMMVRKGLTAILTGKAV
ncbi:MAG: MarC family protein [Phycisphaerae bacterium]|nr:MarC family protein [Phycisphaerae bacterium]